MSEPAILGGGRSSERTVTASRPGVTRMALLDALALGPVVWETVLARTTSPSPFMSWAWHRAWADSVPAAEVAASEALVLRGADGAVQALLPVGYRRMGFHRVPVTALTWAIGDLGCPDHLDVPAAGGADMAALVPALDDLPWQILTLSNLAPNAENARRLGEAIAAHGYAVRRRPLFACPYLELSDDWEGYLATLTPTRRQTLRRKERNLRRHHAVEITDYDGDRVDEGWTRLVTLHERRWKGAGAFRAPEAGCLHRRFAAELAARGQLWLTTLDLDGAAAAAWYGFTWCNTVYFYQSGRDPRWDRESVGLVLMGVMIRRAIERGYRRFDFLRGEDAYKRQWTEAQRRTEEITIFRPGWRGRWLRALDAAAELRARVLAHPGRDAAAGEPSSA
jgi:CelD/BcsL family acetyltransferase involved in cellulose biosynthesis